MYDGTPQLAAQAPPGTAHQTHQFRFTGDAAEYFRIWIVNLFLSIITLGIYSPWAKVRKKRYFYGHTWVADSNFEYHGDPIAIFKGRIVAVVALAIYSGAGYLSPKLGQGILIVLALVAPWLIARSMAFNAHNSSYRQIRFHFKASYQDVLMAIWPFIVVVVAAYFMPEVSPQQASIPTSKELLALLAPGVIAICAYPYIVGAIKRLQVNHSAYGTAPLVFSATIGQFYRVYIAAFGVMLGASFALGLIVALGMGIAFVLKSPAVLWVVIPLAYFLFGAAVFGYTRSRIANLTFNSTTLAGRVQFSSNMSPVGLGKIYFVNLLAITFTLGMMIPWAAMRVARYRAEALTLESASSLETFLGQLAKEVGATGEEMGEFFNFDFSL